MGFFSITRSVSRAWNAGKKVVSKAVDTVKKAVEKSVEIVKEVGSKVYNAGKKLIDKISGKDTFNEAEELMNKIIRRYDEVKAEYEIQIQKFASEIEKYVEKINYHKKNIYNTHFQKFKNIANRVHNIKVEGREFLEYFDDSLLKIKNLDGVRQKSDIYTIDFNALGFKNIAFGILTFGFWTRKKAKETLIKVKEEESRVNEEIEKMKSQVKKTEVVLKAIKNVAEYFDVLVENYVALLDRFEYGVSTQIQKAILDGVELKDGKIDFKLMPVAHLKEFQALFNLSIVLKQMSNMGYLSDYELNEKDIEAVNNIKYKIEKIKLVTA